MFLQRAGGQGVRIASHCRKTGQKESDGNTAAFVLFRIAGRLPVKHRLMSGEGWARRGALDGKRRSFSCFGPYNQM